MRAWPLSASWGPAGSTAARATWKWLLAAAAAATVLASAAGCAMTQDSGGGTLGSVWPFGQHARAQPKTVSEWMAQERPAP